MTHHISSDELREMSFSDVVQLIRKGTNYGYSDASHILDAAIEPHIIQDRKRLLERVEGELPAKQNRKIDEDYGYCITCNQIIEAPEADCFCTIHNLAVDQTIAILKQLKEEI